MRLNEPFWNYWDLLVAIGLCAPAYAANALVLLVIRNAPKVVKANLGTLVFYGVLFGAVYFVLSRKYSNSLKNGLALTLGPISSWKAALAGVVLAFAVSALGALLPAADPVSPMSGYLESKLGLVLVLIASTTIMPVCEEITFRGFLLPLFAKTLGIWPAIVVTALPFALLHGWQYSWAWQPILVLLITGTAFGCMRVACQSTISAGVMHASYNLIPSLISIADHPELSR